MESRTGSAWLVGLDWSGTGEPGSGLLVVRAIVSASAEPGLDVAVEVPPSHPDRSPQLDSGEASARRLPPDRGQRELEELPHLFQGEQF